MNVRDPQNKIVKRKTVDIFCRVVDNYGDAGVCWRLARQMAFEHGLKVRLIIDRLDVLASLVPRLGKALNQVPRKRSRVRRSRSSAPALGYLVDGVRIFEWKTRKSPSPALVGPARLLKPGQLVIAAFACDLPESYRLLMEGVSRGADTRVWINLEYLTAEAWVDGHHLLPSFKPSGLTEHFFFPGFTKHTGGLLRERALLAKRDAFLQDRAAQEKLAAELGLQALFDRPRAATMLVFVFAYPQAPLQSLISAASEALSKPLTQASIGGLKGIERIWFLCPDLSRSSSPALHVPENITVTSVPRLPQERFDEILWLSDANFVRGEDSFVRAIWAGKPMIWNIYPQSEQAHQAKLEAFLALRPAQERALSFAWNQLGESVQGESILGGSKLHHSMALFSEAFVSWLAAFTMLGEKARAFSAVLAQQDDLCTQLLRAGRLAP